MNCPVLTELRLTESYEPEHENPPVLSGGSYDIEAIRSCAENCMAAARIEALEKDNARLREALAWYAIGGHYVSNSVYMGGGRGPSPADNDGGFRARAALEGK